MPEPDDTEWPPHLDALVAAPANHRLLFEDDAVRVLEVTVEPGERENLHHHRWPSLMVGAGSTELPEFRRGRERDYSVGRNC